MKSIWSNAFELAAADAKHEFFLTPTDLQALPYSRVGGFGAGNSRIYLRKDVQRAAIAKFGEEGLAAKVEARLAREKKKRAREEDAKAHEKALFGGGVADGSAPASKKIAVAPPPAPAPLTA